MTNDKEAPLDLNANHVDAKEVTMATKHDTPRAVWLYRAFAAVLLGSLMLAGPKDATARDGDIVAVPELARTFSGLPHRVLIMDPYAFAALDTGVECYDTNDLQAPASVSHARLPSPAYDMHLVGNHLYVANGEAGLAVLDVADPANLVVVSTFALPPASEAIARGVTVAGSVLYLAEAAPTGSVDFGLRSIDISDPQAPVEIGYVPLDNGAHDVVVRGATAFVGLGSELSGRHGLQAIDIADPAAMFEIVSGFLNVGLPVNEIVLNGSTAYIAAGERLVGTLVSAEVMNPASLVQLDRLPLHNGAMGLSLNAGVLHVALRESGVHAVDVSSPSSLVPVETIQTGGLAVTVATSGNLCFVGTRSSNGPGGFSVVDTTQSAVIGRSTQSEAIAVAAAPSLGFLLLRDALQIFDTSAPTSPVWLSTWTHADADFSAITSEGSLVALAEGRTVYLIDVTDPSLPALVSRHDVTDGLAVQPVLFGGVLHVVTGAGLESFNLSSLKAANTTAAIATSGMSSDLAIDDGFGFLTAGEELVVLDMSSPLNPQVFQTLVFPGEELHGVDASGALVVVTGADNRLYSVDFTNPATPLLDGVVPGEPGYAVRLVGDRAIVAAGEAGVRVFDLSSPATPLEEAFHDTSGNVTSLANEGQIIYLASVAAQHWLMQCQTCDAGCLEEWPTVEDNSIRMVRAGSSNTMSWQIDAGLGSYNIHRTETKAEVSTLFADMLTQAGSSASTVFQDSFSPTWVSYYKVYGSGSCTGNSHE